jgi:methionyl-tRNA synthetase
MAGGSRCPPLKPKGAIKMLTADQVREIAERAAEKAAEKVAEKAADRAADKAVTAIMTALGVNINKLTEEQKVWAFARTMQQGTARGALAMVTGLITALTTLVAGAVWYLIFNKPPHP